MATTVMASMSSLAFSVGVRAGRVAPVYGLAPRRRALVVRAQTEVSIDVVASSSYQLLNSFTKFSFTH
jgi:hypothetical protein